jgi:hypothetical protein
MLVLGPQPFGASSLEVKTEVTARLDIWQRGHLEDLAHRVKAQASFRPIFMRIKAQRLARRAARLMYKQTIAKAAQLARSLELANPNLDTLHSRYHLFPEPRDVQTADLQELYGPLASPYRILIPRESQYTGCENVW